MDRCPLNRFYSPAQRKRYREAIPRRYSCRTFAGTPDAGTLSALNYAAARVCLPGIRIVIGDCPEKLFFALPAVGGISGSQKCAYLIASTALETPSLFAGISGEAFVLEAAAMNVGTCWVLGSYRRKLVQVELKENERLVCVIALGTPPAHAQPPARKRKKLSQLCLSDPASWPLWAYNAAEAVRQAPSAVNLQPWKMGYSATSLRLLGKINSLDTGIALLHMEAAAPDNHHWEWGSEKTVAHLMIEENK